MNTIKSDIKDNNFKNIYLLYGDEQFTKRNLKKLLSNAIVSPDDTMNFSRYEGKGINPKEVIDIAQTLPFFGERRLILLENTGYFKSACEPMIDYMSEVPENTYFIFVEEEVDKRSKMYKAVKSKGYACECKRLSNDEIMKWILGRINKDGKKITRDTMNYLIAALGNDMEKISKEVEKLLCYTLDKEVLEISDIDEICCPEITGKIFDMIDAMGAKNKEKALRLYYDLILNREPPMRILFMLARQFNIMLQVKDLSDKGIPRKEIENKLSMQSFIVNKTLGQLKNFSKKDIERALAKSVMIEEDIKMGRITDLIGVEIMLVEFSS